MGNIRWILNNHSVEKRNPAVPITWIPAFAGMVAWGGQANPPPVPPLQGGRKNQ